MTLVTPEQHGLKAHSDGGWDADDKGFVPVQTRSARPKSFEHADFAPVNGLEADWKLTPVKLIKPLLDDALDGTPYAIETDAPENITVEWVARDDARVASAGKPEDRASANAWTNFEKALAITVTGEEHATVRIARSDMGTTARAAHTVITARPHSNSTVLIESSGSALLSENVEIVVEDGATLNVVSVQDWADDAIHLASHFVQVGRDATLKHTVVSLGGKVVRVNPSVHLSGEGADGELYGLYFADEGQHLEQRVYLHHQAAQTRGRVNYKGALQGAGARTVWVGDVLIGSGGSGTDSYEQNRNLVLTEGTRADSIPNLEIETGDIQGAGHASATGRFDDEQLFYLQARGISEIEARRLVVIGFLAEIVQKVGDERLEARLQTAIESELEGTNS
ncbi:Fe-S cluster assembly protein SufD [Salinibacterium sp. M195]|uniref:Fe-S cluster assembly protein SufD n=1 Tax=Salinibacterium sp. M195 TaxID=2583374 RepID=UPI001C629DBA|nr:Fe-S cluster assembly protein SufD [Salinibacterium sp. M195]QYH36180.1 Fe-S cluster assembly protein SufD [Salinibacterium sp. M195]